MSEQPGAKRREPRGSVRGRRAVAVCVAALLLAFVAFQAARRELSARAAAEGAESGDWQTATAVCTSFKQVVRRGGTLKPVNETHIFAKVGGVIQELPQQGKVVAKDEVVLRLDPRPHEDLRDAQDAAIKQKGAEFRKAQQEAAKLLNQAREDVGSYDLRVKLETSRLEELKRGASATDVVNARVNLENARNLLNAREDELVTLTALTEGGYASREELRKKQLDVAEQRLSVAQADIKQRKQEIIDPVAVARQELKVREAVKTRDTAQERVGLMERNVERDLERHQRHMEREKDRLKDLKENVEKTTHLAPGPGLVVHRRHRWFTFNVGREVWENQEILALPDFSKMKVALTVDEAHIANVCLGLEAEVRPAGWNGDPFKGKVSRVADKGRDEFEQFTDETTALSGTANRQVFEVEVEIQDTSPVLRLGLRADVQIVVRTLEQVVVVPRTALVRDRDGDIIVLVEGSRGAERRPVKVAAENDLSAVVEGVKAGERVRVVDQQ